MTAMDDDDNEEMDDIGGSIPNLRNWMRPSGSASVGYASADTSSQYSDDSETASDIGSEIGDYQDNSGENFRDMEQEAEGKPPSPGADVNVNNGQNNVVNEAFVDEGVVATYGQGHRHGATVYDDWGLPISNPSNFREGRHLCRPWLVVVNLFAICLVVGIIMHGGPSTGYDRGRYNWMGQIVMDKPDTTFSFMGEELVGPVPDKHEAENRLVGFGHHVAINENGDRIAIARTSGHRETPGEVYIYSWKDGTNRKHNHPPKPGKWRLEQVLTAELDEDDQRRFHIGQTHTPLAMSASGHRIAFTEGDHVFIFESSKKGQLWDQIAKVQSLDHDADDEAEAALEEAAAEEESEAEEAGYEQVAEDEETQNELEDESLSVEQAHAEKKTSQSEEDDDDDDDSVSEDAAGDDVTDGERALAAQDWERGGNHFGKHLAFSHDGKTLAVMGFSKLKGGYIRVFQDETEDILQDGHDEIHHLFEPTPDIFLEELGDSLALSGDGHKLAIGIATSDDLSNSGTHNGAVQVFGVGADDEWYRIGQPIFGDYPMEGFGGSVSLSENGLVLAVGVAYGGGPVKVYEVNELDHFGKKWLWSQKGQTLHGSHHRQHFGSQVRLNYDGSSVAVGAPGSPDMLERDETIDDDMEQYLHGSAYLFSYAPESHSWDDAGHATSVYEGDAFGYSLALSGDGDRLVIGAPFRIVDDEVNVGVVQVFGV